MSARGNGAADYLGNLQADLALARVKVDNALTSSRMSEKATMDASAALERIERAIKNHQPRISIEPPSPPAPSWMSQRGVRKKRAAEILDCSLATVNRLIARKVLKTYNVGKNVNVTTDSIRAVQGTQ